MSPPTWVTSQQFPSELELSILVCNCVKYVSDLKRSEYGKDFTGEVLDINGCKI